MKTFAYLMTPFGLRLRAYEKDNKFYLKEYGKEYCTIVQEYDTRLKLQIAFNKRIKHIYL